MLQVQLTQGLQQNQNNYTKVVTLSPQSRQELHRWVLEIESCNGSPVVTPPPDLTIYTDASKRGWGGICLNQQANGKWSASEKLLHINFFGIEKCFSINSSTDKRQTFNNGVPQHGQHNRGGLRQSPGRDTFTQTTSTCPAVVELVRPEGHSSSRTSRPRQIEQPRGPGVSSICGQQRLDVTSQPHQALIERLQNGPLCLEAYTPASVLCQLETGSPRLPLRCIQSQLAGTQGLRVSPVQLDSKGLDKIISDQAEVL